MDGESVKDRLSGEKVPNLTMMELQATWAHERAEAHFASRRLLLDKQGRPNFLDWILRMLHRTFTNATQVLLCVLYVHGQFNTNNYFDYCKVIMQLQQYLINFG